MGKCKRTNNNNMPNTTRMTKDRATSAPEEYTVPLLMIPPMKYQADFRDFIFELMCGCHIFCF
jgi:hypothetical protein